MKSLSVNIILKIYYLQANHAIKTTALFRLIAAGNRHSGNKLPVPVTRYVGLQ
jgi:hypothetical protein